MSNLSSHPKVATLLPVRYLTLTRFDEYFMSLSHAAVNIAYAAFFALRAAEGKYVILDNSAVELGHPEDFGSYLLKAQLMNASEILLPDWLQDSERTLKEMYSSLEVLKDLDFKPNVMVVPQGETVGDWLDCAEKMMNVARVSTLGISCRYTDMFGGSRALAVKYLSGLIHMLGRTDLKIHLLGCYSDPRIDAPLLQSEFVRGMDSSYAAVFTSHGMSIGNGAPRPKDRNVDFLVDYYDRELLMSNLAWWWLYTSGGRENEASSEVR